MPRRTISDPRVKVTAYLTRNLPVRLLDRVRAQARTHGTTVEWALNTALEVGLATLERQQRSAR